jgi:hypothetical protein
VDEAASAISIGLRRDIVFNASDFGKIIGIPCGGSPIGSDPEKDVVATVRKILGISARENKINAIEKIVTKVHDKEMTKKEIVRIQSGIMHLRSDAHVVAAVEKELFTNKLLGRCGALDLPVRNSCYVYNFTIPRSFIVNT